ncbi:hypothetical protein LIER_22701 [Lithospermum erythrorhizon]|uniref:Uncharacterized protein n=1 Tax=Lithospermum erythrorhizon TaxID=34254 RepID=A0AAV3QW34_LITER
MKGEFEMSMVGELKYFLGIQINQMKDSIFISQSKYAKNLVKRSMIGSLLYLTASRPDIAHAVVLCARFQANPKESHLNLVKRIIKYEQGTVNHGLSYSFDTNNSLVGYSDADWAGNAEDRKKRPHADSFTKGLDVNQFEYPRVALGLCTSDQ